MIHTSYTVGITTAEYKALQSVTADQKEWIENAIQNKINVAILDDGFQDHSIKKSLSILCFNEKQWIGNGLTIPSGPLRENLSVLKKVNCIVIIGWSFCLTSNSAFAK